MDKSLKSEIRNPKSEIGMPPKPKKRARRILVWIVAAVIVVVVLPVIFAPTVLSSRPLQRLILSRISRQTHGQASVESWSIGWLKGVQVAQLRFRDATGRTNIGIKRIAARPHLASLLGGTLALGQTTIENPDIEIDLRKPPTTSAPQRSGNMSNLTVTTDLVVKDGRLKVTDSQGETVEIARLNSSLSLRPAGQTSNMTAVMAVVSGGKETEIRASGKVTPAQKTGWTLKGTTGQMSVEVNDLDLESLGPLFALAAVDIQTQGHLSAKINGQIQDGRVEGLTATVGATQLSVTGPALKGDRLASSQLRVDADITGKNQMMNISKLDVRTDWASLTAAGTIPADIQQLTKEAKLPAGTNLKGSFDCDLAALLSQMPHQLGIKEGTKITSGKASGTIETASTAEQLTVTGKASVTGLKGQVDGQDVSLSKPVTGTFGLTQSAKKTRLDQMELSAAFASVRASGDFEQIQYEGTVDLGRLQSEFGQFMKLGSYSAAGVVSSKGQVSIQPAKTTAVGSATVTGLRLADPNGNSVSEPQADATFAVNVDQQKKIASITSLQAKASFGELAIRNGIVPLDKSAGQALALDVSAGKVDLGKLRPFAVLFGSMPKDIDLAGVADSQLAVRGSAKGYHVTTDNTTVKGLKVSSSGKKPFEQNQVSVVFDAQVDPNEKTINIQKLQVDSPQIKIRKGQVNQASIGAKGRLKGQMELEYDWEAIGRVASFFLPAPLDMAGRQATVLSFESEYPIAEPNQVVAHMTLQPTALKFTQAQFMGLVFGPTNLDVRMNSGLFSIAPFTSTVNGGRFNFAADADFRKSPTVLRLPKPVTITDGLQLNEETSRKLLAYLNPIFADAVDASGTVAFECQKMEIPLGKAPMETLDIAATISMSNVRLGASGLLTQIISLTGQTVRQQQLMIHPTPFTVQKGVVQYKDMQIDIGDSPLDFGGSIGLDGSLNMTVVLPYSTAGKIVRLAQRSTEPRITLPLKGAVTKPKLDTKRFLELQLQDQLFRGLEGLLKK